jgi:hypothetical protein
MATATSSDIPTVTASAISPASAPNPVRRQCAAKNRTTRRPRDVGVAELASTVTVRGRGVGGSFSPEWRTSHWLRDPVGDRGVAGLIGAQATDVEQQLNTVDWP